MVGRILKGKYVVKGKREKLYRYDARDLGPAGPLAG